jgi:hypothetical protein
MKIFLSSRWLFVLGFVVLVATNILVLSGVAFNRSGDPETLITLTERELRLPYAHETRENGGLYLRLSWQVLIREAADKDDKKYGCFSRKPVWLDNEKLKELGFNIDDYSYWNDNSTYYKIPIPKQVFIVFENNGDSYREAVKRAERKLEKQRSRFELNTGDEKLRKELESAEKSLELEQITNSRLFAIDASLDSQKLRKTYGDRTQFIIVKGLISISKNLCGYIMKINEDNIHVPLKYRNIIDEARINDKQKGRKFELPRYEVELAYGNRFEPWIVSVRSIKDVTVQGKIDRFRE